MYFSKTKVMVSKIARSLINATDKICGKITTAPAVLEKVVAIQLFHNVHKINELSINLSWISDVIEATDINNVWKIMQRNIYHGEVTVTEYSYLEDVMNAEEKCNVAVTYRTRLR